jgi:hypothetical protein
MGGQDTTSGDWMDQADGSLHVCQGEGRGFESRRPLHLKVLLRDCLRGHRRRVVRFNLIPLDRATS